MNWLKNKLRKWLGISTIENSYNELDDKTYEVAQLQLMLGDSYIKLVDRVLVSEKDIRDIHSVLKKRETEPLPDVKQDWKLTEDELDEVVKLAESNT